MRHLSESEHAATQPTGATIVWLGAAGLLAGVALLLPAWVLGVVLKVAVFVAGFMALIVCLERAGKL
jgi:hypothetical protein